MEIKRGLSPILLGRRSRRKTLLKQLATAFFSKKRILVTFLTIVVLAVVLYLFKSLLVVATVDGQPISRWALISELEKRSGKQVLESLVIKTLVLQEAQKQKIKISEEEVSQEIKRLEENFAKQGQDLNQFLETQGVSQKELREQIRLQKILEKMAGKDIAITEKEVEEYLAGNKDFLPKDTPPEKLKEEAKTRLERQKLSGKTQELIDSLREKAKINYFIRF